MGDEANLTHIKCECGALFGIVQPDGSLAIKYRDLFRIVRGAVSGPCRKCGAPMYWVRPAEVYYPPIYYPPNQTVGPVLCQCACTSCVSGQCCMVNGWNRWHLQSTNTASTSEV